SPETMQAKMATGEIRFSDDGKRIIRRTYLADQAALPPSSLWADNEETGSNRQAKYELKKLFDMPTWDLFDTPKPERLLRRIIHLATDPGDIVLDCFVGSGTTSAVAQKMGRRWVGIEASADTITRFTRPRLERVVAGTDNGGVTELIGWAGGGGFRVLDVAPSMFADAGGVVLLAEWATNGYLSEATAAQLGFEHYPEPPFSGRKGKQRLAVIDGLVNRSVIDLVLHGLGEEETVMVCGTALDDQAGEHLRQLLPGSRARKIPASLLAEFRYASKPTEEQLGHYE
ncbi:MAG: hypothetical protein JWP75_3039, partial [Frondihabitans sp.]|nr:hypothetical protein [Frondihabitans sp.]